MYSKPTFPSLARLIERIVSEPRNAATEPPFRESCPKHGLSRPSRVGRRPTFFSVLGEVGS